MAVRRKRSSKVKRKSSKVKRKSKRTGRVVGGGQPQHPQNLYIDDEYDIIFTYGSILLKPNGWFGVFLNAVQIQINNLLTTPDMQKIIKKSLDNNNNATSSRNKLFDETKTTYSPEEKQILTQFKKKSLKIIQKIYDDPKYVPEYGPEYDPEYDPETQGGPEHYIKDAIVIIRLNKVGIQIVNTDQKERM
jgi:hypothetical protein